MNTRISDLLEDYREDSLVAEEETPLSVKRIEAMTMAVVVPKKKHHIRRFVPKALLAAVLASVLAVTALAGEQEWKVSDWFRPAVEQKLRQAQNIAQLHEKQEAPPKGVDQYQLQTIDAHGKTVNQSVTQEGTTVTLLALYGDEYILTLYFRVEVPEGTVLPDDGKYRFRPPNGSSTLMVKLPPGYEYPGNCYPSPVAVPDEDPTDNKKDFVVTMTHAPDKRYKNTETWTFHDDVPKTFTIWGLYRYQGYEKVGYRYRDVYEKLFDGKFEFDVTNAHEVLRKEIDVTGCDYSGHMQYGQNPETKEYAFDYTYTVHPIRLALSPFTAEVETKYETQEPYGYTVLDFEIVMKDGSSQRCGDFSGGYITSEAEDGHSSHVIQFTTPIDLDQIHYILIGNLDHGDTMHKVYP